MRAQIYTFPPAKIALAKYPYIVVLAGAFRVGFLAHPFRSRARTGVEGGRLIRQGKLFPNAPEVTGLQSASDRCYFITSGYALTRTESVMAPGSVGKHFATTEDPIGRARYAPALRKNRDTAAGCFLFAISEGKGNPCNGLPDALRLRTPRARLQTLSEISDYPTTPYIS